MRAAFCSLRAHVRVAHHLHRPPPTTRAASPRAATPRARYPKNQSVESNKTRNLAQAPTRGQVAATTAPISEYEPYMHSTNPNPNPNPSFRVCGIHVQLTSMKSRIVECCRFQFQSNRVQSRSFESSTLECSRGHSNRLRLRTFIRSLRTFEQEFENSSK